jgi:hypothetical protein
MERKTTSTTVTHTQYGDLTTKSTRITQESRLDRSRRIASQNSTLFRFALSGTIVFLFFGLFLLIGTTDYYNANAQELKWIDDNGQFIENSYNLQVTITNDTPLDELNELFVDSQIALNSEFSNGTTNFSNNNSTFTVSNGRGTLLGSGTASDMWLWQNGINVVGNDYYFISSIRVTTSNYTKFRYFNGASFVDYDFKVPADVNYYNLSTKFTSLGSNFQLIAMVFPNSTAQNGHGYLIDYFRVYNLTDLGINLTKQELDEYYNIWEENKQSRSLETYNNLGNIPVTNLENMNSGLFKPAVDIVNGLTDTASGALGFSLQAWNFVIDIWNRIWGG